MTLFLILLIVGLSGCNSFENPSGSQESEQTKTRVKQIVEQKISIPDFAERIKSEDHCMVFITTEWCGGGKLYLNNSVLPNYNRINDSIAPFYVAYLGDYDQLGLNPDSLAGENSLTLYHLDVVSSGIAFFDKRDMRKFLKLIDPTAEYQSVVPMRIEYKNGRAKYLKKSFSKF